jgi:hypothetical protein
MVKPEKKTRPVREAEPGRRGFFLKIWLGLGVLALGEVVWAVLSYLRPFGYRGQRHGLPQTATAMNTPDKWNGSHTSAGHGRGHRMKRFWGISPMPNFGDAFRGHLPVL